MSKRLTQEEFIKRSVTKHDNKYDYTKSEYIGIDIKIIIICREHGEFLQTPHAHMYGRGCHKCGKKTGPDKQKLTQFEFIDRATKVHNNKFDYSQVEYNRYHDKVKIICHKHGVFEQSPANHLKGKGCPICADELWSKKKTKTTEQFIKEAQLVHGNKFDYSLVNYIGCFDAVCIICPKHGQFRQTPDAHIVGKGCPICNESQGEKAIEKFLISINEPFERWKMFDDCISPKGKKYKFDFWLKQHKLIIEFDGAQHRIPVPYFSKTKTLKEAKKNLKIQKENDANKDKYATNKGYTMLRIQEVDQVNTILSNTLNQKHKKV